MIDFAELLIGFDHWLIGSAAPMTDALPTAMTAALPAAVKRPMVGLDNQMKLLALSKI